MADILTEDRKGLKIFVNGVRVNESLDKWKNAKKVEHKKDGNTYIVPNNMLTTPDGTSTNNTYYTINVQANWADSDAEEPMKSSAQELQLDDIAKMELLELNKYIKEHNLMYVLTKTGRYNTYNSVEFKQSKPIEIKVEKGLFNKLKSVFSKKEEEIPEIDVVAFFTMVKNLTKESANGYVDRVQKYLKAIHNARIIGQTALIEKLTREMVANRYEAFLFASGHYHVVTEEQVVEFAKKSSRGISIDYIENFVRPIPECVIEKIAEADKMEVFDNYVIMHYDPKGTSVQDTAKEEAKKRDPIVFGVIAGSTKLYYIADWIDEYCDLTLDKFVDTLGITKDDLVIDEEEKENIKNRADKKSKEDEMIKKVAKEITDSIKKKKKSETADEVIAKDIKKQRKKKETKKEE